MHVGKVQGLTIVDTHFLYFGTVDREVGFSFEMIQKFSKFAFYVFYSLLFLYPLRQFTLDFLNIDVTSLIHLFLLLLKVEGLSSALTYLPFRQLVVHVIFNTYELGVFFSSIHLSFGSEPGSRLLILFDYLSIVDSVCFVIVKLRHDFVVFWRHSLQIVSFLV